MSEIRNLTRNGETFYPLTTSSAVINEATGEGLIIDNEPTPGSNNLVKSGGVFGKTYPLSLLNRTQEDIIAGAGSCKYQGILRRDNVYPNNVEPFSDYFASDFIETQNRHYLFYNELFPNNGNRVGLALYDTNKTLITVIGNNSINLYTNISGIIDLSTDYPSAKYVRFCLGVSERIDGYICLTDNKDFVRKNVFDSITSVAYSGDGYNSSYQYNKLSYIECHVLPEYEGCELLINQLGWFQNSLGFLFSGTAIRKGENYTPLTAISVSNGEIGVVSYSSIPLDDVVYTFELRRTNDNVLIGFITFKYLWSKINGDTANHILNIVIDNYGYEHGIHIRTLIGDYTKLITEKELSEHGITLGELQEYGYKMNFTPEGTFNSNNQVVTIKDSMAEEDIILKELTLFVKVAGRFKIGIGHLDQRSWYLEVSHFYVETEDTGQIVFDLSSHQIIVPKGEQIFVYVKTNGAESIGFNSGTNEKGFYWGNADGVLDYYPNGGYCTIYVTGYIMKTPFAYNSDLNAVKEEVSSVSAVANSAFNNNFKVKDRQGNLYKMLVVAGELQIIPMEFSNVLVIGNSICEHPQTEQYGGWYASGRGMASSVVGNDYCGILQTAFRRKNQNAVVTRYTNLVSWFRNPTDLTDAKFEELFGNILQNNYDLVVFRLSENNNTNINLMRDAIVACINYVWGQLPQAEVVITSDVMDNNASKNAQLSAAATELGVTYVDANCRDNIYKYRDSNGNYCPFYYTGDDLELYPIQEMFHTHPNDLGMLKVANAILGGLNYERMNISHSITISCSQEYNAWQNGVEGGVITILLYGTSPNSIQIRDANNNVINYALHDMSNVSYYSSPSIIPTYGITFTMPSSDVNVTIS